MSAPHLLIVEDCPLDLMLLERVIERSPWELQVTMQRTAEDALAWLSAAVDQPHAILTDLSLPRMDGFEFLAALGEQPSLRAIPVLVYSGVRHPRWVKRIEASHASRFLEKPGGLRGFTELIDTVAEFVTQRRAT